MKKEFDRLKFNFYRNRKNKNTVQIRKLNNYIAATRAMEYLCEDIISMADNPFLKEDPEAILLNLKDHFQKRLKFYVEEKNTAYDELGGLIKLNELEKQDLNLEEDIFEPIMK